MHLRLLAVTACLAFPNAAANAAVTLNGTVLPQADARPDVSIALRQASSDMASRF